MSGERESYDGRTSAQTAGGSGDEGLAGPQGEREEPTPTPCQPLTAPDPASGGGSIANRTTPMQSPTIETLTVKGNLDFEANVVTSAAEGGLITNQTTPTQSPTTETLIVESNVNVKASVFMPAVDSVVVAGPRTEPVSHEKTPDSPLKSGGGAGIVGFAGDGNDGGSGAVVQWNGLGQVSVLARLPLSRLMEIQKRSFRTMIDEEPNGVSVEGEGSTRPSKRRALETPTQSQPRKKVDISLGGAFSRGLGFRELVPSRTPSKRQSVGHSQTLNNVPFTFKVPATVVAPPHEDTSQKPLANGTPDAISGQEGFTTVESPQPSRTPSQGIGNTDVLRSQTLRTPPNRDSLTVANLSVSRKASDVEYIGFTPSFEGFGTPLGSGVDDAGSGGLTNPGQERAFHTRGRVIGYTESFQGFQRQGEPDFVGHGGTEIPVPTGTDCGGRVGGHKGKQRETRASPDPPSASDSGLVETVPGPSNPFSRTRKKILRTLSGVQVARKPSDNELGIGEKRLVR